MSCNFRCEDKLNELPAVYAAFLLQIVNRIVEMERELELDSSQKIVLDSWMKSLEKSVRAG